MWGSTQLRMLNEIWVEGFKLKLAMYEKVVNCKVLVKEDVPIWLWTIPDNYGWGYKGHIVYVRNLRN